MFCAQSMCAEPCWCVRMHRRWETGPASTTFTVARQLLGRSRNAFPFPPKKGLPMAAHSRRLFVKGAAALGATHLASHAGLAFAAGETISATTYPGAAESAHRSILLP